MSSRWRSPRAWYKLLHRAMGPVSRFLGPWVAEPQHPVPAVEGALVSVADVATLKQKVLDSGVEVTVPFRAAGVRPAGPRPPGRPAIAA